MISVWNKVSQHLRCVFIMIINLEKLGKIEEAAAGTVDQSCLGTFVLCKIFP